MSPAAGLAEGNIVPEAPDPKYDDGIGVVTALGRLISR
jgi:hypothetical protein